MPRGWKLGRHLWTVTGWHRGENGAVVTERTCRLCGLKATSQSFSRARTPWCYWQQEICFDGPGIASKPPPAASQDWTQDDAGNVAWRVKAYAYTDPSSGTRP